MANCRKAKKLNSELKMLDGQERDYIEKLANSLLDVQNTPSKARHSRVDDKNLHGVARRKRQPDK